MLHKCSQGCAAGRANLQPWGHTGDGRGTLGKLRASLLRAASSTSEGGRSAPVRTSTEPAAMQAAPPPIIVTSVSRMVTDSSGMVATHVGLLGRDIYGSLQ